MKEIKKKDLSGMTLVDCLTEFRKVVHCLGATIGSCGLSVHYTPAEDVSKISADIKELNEYANNIQLHILNHWS